MYKTTPCTICGYPKMLSVRTDIYVCTMCDTAGEFIWPKQYIEWAKGMPYPGEQENADG